MHEASTGPLYASGSIQSFYLLYSDKRNGGMLCQIKSDVQQGMEAV